MLHLCHERTIDTSLTNELLTFFKSAYGAKFLGTDHFREAYLGLATGVTMLRDEKGNLAAAQVIRRGRLTAGATTPEPTEGGSRRQVMSQLLVMTRPIEPQGWVTIDDRINGMKVAAQMAGMVPLTDPEDVHSRLERFGEASSHTIIQCVGGLAVARMTSQHPRDYTQHAWGWPLA